MHIKLVVRRTNHSEVRTVLTERKESHTLQKKSSAGHYVRTAVGYRRSNPAVYSTVRAAVTIRTNYQTTLQPHLGAHLRRLKERLGPLLKGKLTKAA